MKKYFLLLVSVGIVVVGAFIFINSKTKNTTDNTGTNVARNTNSVITADFNTHICDQIPKNLIEKALGKTVTEIEPTSGNVTNTCDYYTNKENHITIRLNKLNYENQKSGQSGIKGVETETDSSISAEHFIVIPNQQPTIVNIIIKINDSLLLTVENGLSTEYSKKQMVTVASEVVNYLISNPMKNVDNADKGNTTEQTNKSQNSQSHSQSQKSLVTDFFAKLAAFKIQDALVLMDANDNTKQAWGVNFNTIEKLAVRKIDEAFKEEWSENRQSFKVELDVKVKPEGERMGWQNGTNFRWVTLEKNSDGKWLIHELANNP